MYYQNRFLSFTSGEIFWRNNSCPELGEFRAENVELDFFQASRAEVVETGRDGADQGSALLTIFGRESILKNELEKRNEHRQELAHNLSKGEAFRILILIFFRDIWYWNLYMT